MLVGGYVYPRTGVSLGPYANEMLARLERAAHGAQRGRHQRSRLLQQQLLLVETERAMMKAAEEVIVVADSTKFGHQSLAHLCAAGRKSITWSSIARLIAATGGSKIEAAGVELLVIGATALEAQPRRASMNLQPQR